MLIWGGGPADKMLQFFYFFNEGFPNDKIKIGNNKRCSLEFQKHYKILKFPNLQILDLYSSFRLNFSSPSNLVKYETRSKLFEIS